MPLGSRVPHICDCQLTQVSDLDHSWRGPSVTPLFAHCVTSPLSVNRTCFLLFLTLTGLLQLLTIHFIVYNHTQAHFLPSAFQCRLTCASVQTNVFDKANLPQTPFFSIPSCEILVNFIFCQPQLPTISSQEIVFFSMSVLALLICWCFSQSLHCRRFYNSPPLVLKKSLVTHLAHSSFLQLIFQNKSTVLRNTTEQQRKA